LQDIAARQDQVGRCGPGGGLFDQPLHLRQHAIARARIDHAIAGRLLHGDFQRADQIAADLFIGVDHLLHATIARRALHEFVGQQDGERFVTDNVARAPDGMAKAQRFLLTQEHRIARREPRSFQRGQILAAFALQGFAFEGHVEIIFDRALAAPGDEDHLLDPGLARFIHGILEQRAVDHRQQFLGHRLGRGQKARAQSRDRKNSFANRLVQVGLPLTPRPPRPDMICRTCEKGQAQGGNFPCALHPILPAAG